MGIRLQRMAILGALLLLLVAGASANYHFVHYRSLQSPQEPVYEKFDLNALVDNTVRYYVRSTGPEQLAPGDSLTSLLSQIRLAAEVWNGVSTSSLRVGFGGIADADTVQNAPGIDIIFDDGDLIPPGLLAVGGPTSRAELVVGEDGAAYVPITRAVVVLQSDLSGQPSSSDSTFMTILHEMGHALGLQHTFTSSVMATSGTRTTTKARPLAGDDTAGLSILYPAPGFAESTGVISGRIVLGDDGVNLASVVALTPQGASVSTLTNPDGTYRLSGIPTGQYYVYVHPLPPAVESQASRADIVMPLGPEGESIVANSYFDTQFYPGVKSIAAASMVTVTAGQTVENVDLFVNARGVPSVHTVRTFSYPGTKWIDSGHVSLDATWRFLLVAWPSLDVSGGLPAGLDASFIGGSAVIPDAGGLSAYQPEPRFVQLNLEFNPFSGTGPRHLLLSLGNDIFVRPSALQITAGGPPRIESVADAVDDQGRAVVAVTGTRITPTSRILFDGVKAEFAGEPAPGQLLVRAPAAPSGHRAAVTALNSDGQTSWFLAGDQLPSYEYPLHEPGSFSVSPALLPAGTEAMVEIHGINTTFDGARTELGLGSSDIVVRDVLVLAPDLILANVAVAHNAPEVAVAMTATTGLEIVNQPFLFQTGPADPNKPSLHSPAYDPQSGRAVAFAGKPALVRVTSLPPNVTPAEATLTLNGQAATVLSIDQGWLEFEVPSDTRSGPVVARFSGGGLTAAPILLNVAIADPTILSAHTETGAVVSPESPVRPGDFMQLRVADLAPADVAIAPESLQVSVAGIAHTVSSVLPTDGQPEIRIVQFWLGTTVPPGEQVAVTVTYEGRVSEPTTITVVAP